MTDPQRPPAATLHERQQANIEEEYGAKGRWTGHDRPTVTAGSPQWQAPRINGVGPWAGPDPVPNEECLGFSIEDLPDMTTASGIDRHLLTPPSPDDTDTQPTEDDA
jgi:hypothetical protein